MAFQKKTVLVFAVFYGALFLAAGAFVTLKYGYFLGNLKPGESKVFQASLFVDKLSKENSLYFQIPGTQPPQWRAAGPEDKLTLSIEAIHNFGFFIEYSRQPRITFDYRITARPDAKPGRYHFKVVFDSGFEYEDNVTVKRSLPFL